MKKRAISLFVAVLVGIFLCGIGSALPMNVVETPNADGSYNVTDCTVLNESGVYVLNQSVTTTGTCFNISADNVVLDGGGKTITGYESEVGDSNAQGHGVYADGRNNITIENFANIEGFGSSDGDDFAGIYFLNTENSIIRNVFTHNSYGIYLYSSSNNIFYNTTSTSNYNNGIYLSGSSNNIFYNTTSTSNYNNGISLVYLSSNNIFYNTTSTSNNYNGIYLDSSSNNIFYNTTSTSNYNNGIYLYSSLNNTFYNTTSDLYNYNGIYLDSSLNNTFYNTTSTSNNYEGIYLYSSLNNIFYNTTSTSNYNNGIYLYSSLNNTFYNTTSTSNYNDGISLTSSLNNTFYNTTSTSNNNNGIYLYSSLNNTFYNTTSDLNDNGISLTSSSNNTFYNLESYSNVNNEIVLSGSTGNVLKYNNSYGEIKFSSLSADIKGNLTFNDANTGTIKIQNNSAYVNSSISGLNISANITLYGLSSLYEPANVLKDGVKCNAPNCNILNSSGGNVTFNVTSWSSYSIDFSPVVYLFPVENSTSISRTFTYNVSDDSDVKNCSLYSNDVLETTNATVNNNENNSIMWNNKFSVGTYTVYISCTDEYGNVGSSNNVTFVVTEVPVEEEPQTASGGGGTYSLTESVLDKGLNRNVWKGVVWKFNAGNENHTITFNNVSSDILIFTVASSPRIFNVKINESVLIDVEEDGDYDLNITYNKYYGRLANVGIKAISVNDGKESPVVNGSTEVEVITEKDNYTDWIIGIIIVALIIVGLVWANRRSRAVAGKKK